MIAAIVQRVRDYLRERRITWLRREVCNFDNSKGLRRWCLLEMQREIGERSANQIARMERQKGLQ